MGLRRPFRLHRSAAFLGMTAILFAKVVVARALILQTHTIAPALISEAVLVLALLGLVELLFRRWRYAAYVVLDTVFSIFLVSLTAYAAFFERMIDPGALRFAGQLGTVGSSVLTLLAPAYLAYFVDIPFVAYFAAKAHAGAGDRQRHAVAVSWGVVSALVVTPAILIWAGSAPANVDEMALARTRGLLALESSVIAKRLLGERLLEQVGVSGQAVADEAASGAISYDDPASVQDAIEEISRREAGERIADFAAGEYEGAHVIVLQMESLQRFAIDPWITPNLASLADESWYFPNGFTAAGWGTTSDAEFAMNSGFYPPEEDAASVAYADRLIPALPRFLENRGYHSFTMHANTVNYWNRKELYPALGFSTYYDREFFGTEDRIGMGASDESFFTQALPVIAEEATKGPVYCQLVTLTPHHPFKMPPETVQIELPPWLAGTLVGDYLQSMNYEDRQVGTFFEGLKAAGLWDTSIIVVYGDHAGPRAADLSRDPNRQSLETLIGHSYTAMDAANIPIIIHLPRQSAGVLCATPMSQVDIMPTLADALGLDLSQTVTVGRSAFVDSRPLIAGKSGLPRGSFANDRIVLVAGAQFESSLVFSLRTREPEPTGADDERDWSAVRALLDVSDTYVRGLPRRQDSRGIEDAILPRKLMKY